MRIDFRTLAFSDHCGIILDFDINPKDKLRYRQIRIYENEMKPKNILLKLPHK